MRAYDDDQAFNCVLTAILTINQKMLINAAQKSHLLCSF